MPARATTTEPNPFAVVDPWTVREDGAPAESHGFAFAEHAAGYAEQHRPFLVVAPGDDMENMEGVGLLPYEPPPGTRWQLDRAILGVLRHRASRDLLAGERTVWAQTQSLGVDGLLRDLRAAGELPEPVDAADAARQRDRVKKRRAKLAERGAIVHVGNRPAFYRDGRKRDGANVYFVPMLVRVDGALVPSVVKAPRLSQSPNMETSPAERAGDGCGACGRGALLVRHDGSELCADCLASNRRPTCRPVRAAAGDRRSRRVQGALRWALGRGRPGCRNHVGAQLCFTLRSIGLTEGEAGPVMERYRREVSPRGDAYTGRETRATLRSVYRPRRRAATCPPPNPALAASSDVFAPSPHGRPQPSPGKQRYLARRRESARL